jgi:hypothetical protein
VERQLTLESFHNRLGLLSGVWFTEAEADPPDSLWKDQPVDYMYFMLDGYVYRVQEDPDDGYRSHLEDIIVVDQMPLNVWQPAEEVMGHHAQKQSELIDHTFDPESYYEDRCNIVQLISTTTAKPVLEFGTDYSDDYYPSFVARFYPLKMGINERQAILLGEENEIGKRRTR